MISKTSLFITLLFLFPFTILAQFSENSEFVLELSAGANHTQFESFPTELSNTPKLGHSLTVGASLYNKWGLSSGVTLRHYKNELALAGANQSNAMSVDLLNFHLYGEGPLVVIQSLRVTMLAGMGLDYNFSIKSDPIPVDKGDFNTHILNFLFRIKNSVSALFLCWPHGIWMESAVQKWASKQ